MANKKKSPFNANHINWSAEEEERWLQQVANLCLDMFVEKYGYLPRPPTDKEYRRLMQKIKEEEKVISDSRNNNQRPNSGGKNNH
ncbi:MAG TPA: hypothetical protein VHA78_03255 [Candidatus Peribacteraceae bacterium]|nr:hypothetical protein [Candidatus Peribacteraceae bacterium]